INFEDDYFQEIINPDFKKIDSPFQQTSPLKPYVPNVILEKIIIDLEDEVVNLLEKEKVNLETIESLKSKSFGSSEKLVLNRKIKVKMTALLLKKSVTKRRILKRPKNNGVIWKKKGSSNTSNVGLSAVSVLNLNKNVKRYSRKDLLACNNSHLEEISSASIVQICLWIIDSGCSKYMTSNHALLTNFVEKFLGTVGFGNNDFGVIAGYGDVVIDCPDLSLDHRFGMFKAHDG
nr:integrase, catalytic region, zinc finger, CCHC-type, peptidase aspartic, catalytic [Tanacetum cinerariifolium]